MMGISKIANYEFMAECQILWELIIGVINYKEGLSFFDGIRDRFFQT
jgi:hypothetical protein